MHLCSHVKKDASTGLSAVLFERLCSYMVQIIRKHTLFHFRKSSGPYQQQPQMNLSAFILFLYHKLKKAEQNKSRNSALHDLIACSTTSCSDSLK